MLQCVSCISCSKVLAHKGARQRMCRVALHACICQLGAGAFQAWKAAPPAHPL